MSIFTHLKFILQSGAGSIFQIFVAVIRTKVIATTLGTHGVGTLGQLADLNQIQSILVNLGYSTAAVTEISEARGKKDLERIHKIRAALLNLTLLNAVLVTIVSLIFSKQISSALLGSSDFAFYVQLVSLSVLAMGVSSAYSTFLSADKLIKELMLQNIIGSMIAAVMIIFLVLYDGLRGAVIGMTLNAFIGIIINIKFLRNAEIPLYIRQIGNFNIDRRLLKLFLSFTVITLLTSILIRVSNLYAKSLIISYSDLSQAGLFQAALSISNQYLPILLGAIGTYLLPHLSETTSFEKMTEEVLVATRTVLLLAFPFLSGLMLFSSFIIQILYSKEFIETASVVSITVFGDLIIVLAKILVNVFMTKRMFYPWLIGDIILSIMFPTMVYFFYPSFALLGVAVGYNISLLSVLVWYLIVLKKIGFSFSKEVIILLSLFLVILIFLFLGHLYITSLIGLVAVYLVGNILFFVASVKKKEFKLLFQKAKSYL
jgi:enterobacterial common antigen flippase